MALHDPKNVVSIQRHFVEQERQAPQATGALTSLLWDLSLAIKTIAHEVRRAGLTGILGSVATKNVHGETQKKLDVYADEVMVEILQRNEHIGLLASEEHEEPITIPKRLGHGKYVILFDPLDGSSNFDINASIGTIFSIYERKTNGTPAISDLLRRGEEQVAAGYALYGSSTMLVYTTGNGVNGFTLEPDLGEFLLSHPKMKIPARGKYYSVSESYFNEYSIGTQTYLTENRNRGKERLKHRNIGTLVADVHRVLLKGGIHLNPPRYLKGKTVNKLRLLYEVAPFSWLVEQAGGMATSEGRRSLDIKATTLHETVSTAMGSPADVDRYNQHLT